MTENEIDQELIACEKGNQKNEDVEVEMTTLTGYGIELSHPEIQFYRHYFLVFQEIPSDTFARLS